MLKGFHGLHHEVFAKDQTPIFLPDMTDFPRHNFDEKSQGTPNR